MSSTPWLDTLMRAEIRQFTDRLDEALKRTQARIDVMLACIEAQRNKDTGADAGTGTPGCEQ